MSLKLMCVLAHPDDESLGMGGTLAKYAAEGVETYLLTATRGERGWFGEEHEYPGLEALGKIREQELQGAAKALGIHEVQVLDYIDGELDQANLHVITAEIVSYIRRVRPDVVITFDPYGAYGHPDHIAICQFTTGAIIKAADAGYALGDRAPHSVSKLYYRVETREALAIYEQAFGELVMHIDGAKRQAVGWQDWAITTVVDTVGYWQQVWEAVSCHQTQLPGYDALKKLPEHRQQALWRSESYYRVFSLVNSGRELETDLFKGLRKQDA